MKHFIICNMKQFTKFTIVALLFSILISCKKESEGPSLSPEEQQQLKEEKEVLQPNEMLETEGLRFILSWAPQDSIQLNLKLYKGEGATKSLIPLIEDSRDNYAIVTKGLENNVVFTLEVGYTQVLKTGTFDLTVIGFTAMPTTKRFTIGGNSFTTINAGTNKDFLRISKGVTKFTFVTL